MTQPEGAKLAPVPDEGEPTQDQRTVAAQHQTILTLQGVIASQAVEIFSLRQALASTQGQP